jgi:hypothetical protein
MKQESPIPGSVGSSENRRFPLQTCRIELFNASKSLLFYSFVVLLYDCLWDHDDPISFLREKILALANRENKKYVFCRGG